MNLRENSKSCEGNLILDSICLIIEFFFTIFWSIDNPYSEVPSYLLHKNVDYSRTVDITSLGRYSVGSLFSLTLICIKNNISIRQRAYYKLEVILL